MLSECAASCEVCDLYDSLAFLRAMGSIVSAVRPYELIGPDARHPSERPEVHNSDGSQDAMRSPQCEADAN